MNIRTWNNLKYLLILLVIINAIWTVSLFRKSIYKQNVLENSITRVTEADKKGINGVTIGDPVGIPNLPKIINSWNLSEKDGKWFFIDDKGVYRSLFYNNHHVSSVQLSPSHKKMGFYFYPEDHSLGNIVLAVLDIDQEVVREIYGGDNWTSNWEWKGEGAVIVKRSCGTSCMNAYVIDILTGEQVDSYRVY